MIVNVYKNIGKAIKQKRLEKGMTQEELASKVGLTRTSIVQIESGKQKITVEALFNVCDQLEMTMKLTRNFFFDAGEEP